jgi:hypothetical protein
VLPGSANPCPLDPTLSPNPFIKREHRRPACAGTGKMPVLPVKEGVGREGNTVETIEQRGIESPVLPLKDLHISLKKKLCLEISGKILTFLRISPKAFS